jgi:hypothetical protein
LPAVDPSAAWGYFWSILIGTQRISFRLYLLRHLQFCRQKLKVLLLAVWVVQGLVWPRFSFLSDSKLLVDAVSSDPPQEAHCHGCQIKLQCAKKLSRDHTATAVQVTDHKPKQRFPPNSHIRFLCMKFNSEAYLLHKINISANVQS